MKTATIERLPIWGTPYHALNLKYRGEILWQEIDRGGFLTADRYGSPLAELHRVAKIHSFTHLRFIGDWHKKAKPRGGRL